MNISALSWSSIKTCSIGYGASAGRRTAGRLGAALFTITLMLGCSCDAQNAGNHLIGEANDVGMVSTSSNAITLFPAAPETPVAANGLPDAPQRMEPVAPAFDSLRLNVSSLFDEGAQGVVQPVPRAVSVNTSTVSTLHRIMRLRFTSRKPENTLPPEQMDEPWRYEPYHWRGLIAQSLFFSAVESSFRLANDDQIRRLLARKPFWHDYFASIRRFNMGRWSDGDNFLVNYIGHPMQGAVSGFIEVQNDPVGRQQEISATHDYWVSRFKGFLWATAFSVHSEISPLGEAGIGNEGGWTYPIANCHRPCTQYNPKTDTYTNNTGWVDFIVTPTVGTLWMIGEDALDRYISDRVQGFNRAALFPNILRGALNPSRTMANAMRLKAPWYRDFQHGLPPDRTRNRIHMLAGDDESATATRLKRFAISAHYRATPIGSAKSFCAVCNASSGSGIEADYAITQWISASFSLDKQAGLMTPKELASTEASGAADATGSTMIAGFGVRLIRDRPHNTLSLAIRPGVVVDQVTIPGQWDSVRQAYSKSREFSVTHTAASILLSNDYKINPRFAVRSSFGALIVRYRTQLRDPDYIGKPPYLSFLSQENFTNRTTWTWQGGPVFHF